MGWVTGSLGWERVTVSILFFCLPPQLYPNNNAGTNTMRFYTCFSCSPFDQLVLTHRLTLVRGHRTDSNNLSHTSSSYYVTTVHHPLPYTVPTSTIPGSYDSPAARVPRDNYPTIYLFIYLFFTIYYRTKIDDSSSCTYQISCCAKSYSSSDNYDN